MKRDNIFTIIIISYNNTEYIKDCIKSVIEQSYKAIEIIISDDGSEQFDRKDIEKFLLENCKENIISTIINVNTENKGTVKNINIALNLSSGDFIMILSCDDMLYDSEVISSIVNYFIIEKCQSVIGFIEAYDTEMNKVKAVYPRRRVLDFINTHESIDIFYRLCESVILPGPGFTFSKEVLKIYGLYDETYTLMEDYPRYLYLMRSGCSIKFIDRKIVKYRHGGITSKEGKDKNSKIKKIFREDLNKVKEKEITPYLNKKQQTKC